MTVDRPIRSGEIGGQDLIPFNPYIIQPIAAVGFKFNGSGPCQLG